MKLQRCPTIRGHLLSAVKGHGAVLGSSQEKIGGVTVVDGSMVSEQLGVNTVVLQAALLLPLGVVVTRVRSETPLLGDNDLLAARELELGTTKSLAAVSFVVVLAADRQKNLANVHASAGALGLAEGATHTGLKPISSGARKHLVDAEHVEGVDAHAQVERFLTGGLGNVLVAGNTRRLKSLRGDLLLLPTDKVDAQREAVHAVPLHTHIVDTNLRVRHTAAETRLRVWLVLDLAVAPRWTTTHG